MIFDINRNNIESNTLNKHNLESNQVLLINIISNQILNWYSIRLENKFFPDSHCLNWQYLITKFAPNQTLEFDQFKN